MNGEQNKDKALAHIGQALDEIGLQWLEEQHPTLTDAIERAVGRGVPPERIKRFVLARVERPELALRCEQAARHIARGGE